MNIKVINTLEEEQCLNTGYMIYFEFIPQKKLSYGGSKNWFLIRDMYTKQNGLSLKTQRTILVKLAHLS